MQLNVLFVCLGNICRSPTAHVIFQSMVHQQGLHQYIHVDSCGTGDWHVGHAPDKRAQQSAANRGYDLLVHRARQVSTGDFEAFDYIYAMDRQNLHDLRAIQPGTFTGHLGLFLPGEQEVPDPYYGDHKDFEKVIDLIESSCRIRLEELKQRYSLV